MLTTIKAQTILELELVLLHYQVAKQQKAKQQQMTNYMSLHNHNLSFLQVQHVW